MWINIAGEIPFIKELTSEEVDQLKQLLDFKNKYGNSINTECIELYDAYDNSDAILEWLKDHDNGVVEGTVIEYYGDYDGSYRLEDGEWVGYDRESICNMGDERLLNELAYRGYDVSGLREQFERYIL